MKTSKNSASDKSGCIFMSRGKGLIAAIILAMGLLAPALTYASPEDCVKDVGNAICSSPIGAPAIGVNPETIDPEGWSFSICDDSPASLGRAHAWCDVLGGTWVFGPSCEGAGGVTEKDLRSLSNNFGRRMHETVCSGPTLTDTNWGVNVSSYNCWSGQSTYKSGLLVKKFRSIGVTGVSLSPPPESDCTISWQEPMIAMAVRDIKCPPGYNSRNKMNGDLECWKPPCCSTKVGNPIDVGSGAKKQQETDYAPAMNGGVSLVRYYDSFGHYREPGSPEEPVSPWKFGYERRIYPIQDSAHAMASAYRPDGQVKYFSLSGAEIQNVNGANARLERLITGGTLTGWKYTSENDEIEIYSVAGGLLSITNRQGVTQTLNYFYGHLISVIDTFGHRINFEYDPEWVLTAAVDPSGGRHEYSFDIYHNLVSVTHPDSSKRHYLYNEPSYVGSADFPNALTGIVDENDGRYASWYYDSSGRAIQSVHANGSDQTAINYSNPNSIVVTDALGQSTTYAVSLINGIRRITSMQSCVDVCSSALTSYDSNGNVASRTDEVGNTATYLYDSYRNLEITRTEAAGTAQSRTITTTWHPTFHLPATIEEPGRTTTLNYDGVGNLEQKTITDTASGRSRSWAYTYDSYGRVLTEDGPRTDVSDLTTYSYYPIVVNDPKSGQLQSVMDAAGLTTTYTAYNWNGKPLSSTDPNGIATTYTYTSRGQLQSQLKAGETTTYHYYLNGLLEKVVHPSGVEATHTYDAAHRLTDIEDADGNRLHFTLDAAGNLLREDRFDEFGQLVQTRSQIFDAKGRLYQKLGATSGERTTYGYDHKGNVLSVTDAFSNQTRQEYDAFDRLHRVIDPDNGVIEYAYDDLGELASVTDPRGLETEYTVDALGNVLQLDSPDTGTTVSTYDNAGNVLTRKDAKNQTTSFQYDALNRLTQITHADSSLVSFGYDQGTNGLGRRTSQSDGSGSTVWTYDAQGRVATKTQAASGLNLVTEYDYDSAGRLQSLTLPSGNVVGYSWSGGQISGLTINGSNLLSNLKHHPFGPPTRWDFANGEAVARDYNLDGRVVRVSMGDLVLPTGLKTYGYDAQNRLTSYSGPGASIGYAYDANGNRTQQLTNATEMNYEIDEDSNRIAGVDAGSGAFTPTYDANGSTTVDLTNSYSYNAAGRLVSANGVSYTYNGQGQRVSKSASGSAVIFVYDESGQLLGEYDQTGATIQETIWLGNMPVAVIKPNGLGIDAFFVHADHLNTPRSIDDAQGQAVWVWDTITFGASQPNEDPHSTGMAFVYNLRHPGQYFDEESGLFQNWHRDYDPSLGRYIESDPIGLNGGISTYPYVKSSPLTEVDPSGLIKWKGTGFSGSAAVLFYDRYVLNSECAGGIRYMVQVEASGLTYGLGLPITATGGYVEFHDNYSVPEPSVFNGLYVKAGGGGALGGGVGTSTVLMGAATSDPDIGMSYGIDSSFGVSTGRSRVVSAIKQECCQ